MSNTGYGSTELNPQDLIIQGSQLELQVGPLQAPVAMVGKEGRRCEGSWIAKPRLLMRHLFAIYKIECLLMFDSIPGLKTH